MEAAKIEAAAEAELKSRTDDIPPKDDGFNDPQQLPFWRKCAITACLAGVTFTVTFCSSVWSSTFPATAEEFQTTTTVLILGVSLYVVGFAIGPLVWGPVSELLGRKIPIFTGFTIFALLQIPISLVHSLPALLVLRFLAGAFGAAPVSLVSATYADFWAPVARGHASALYSVVCFVGPTMVKLALCIQCS